MENEEQPLSEKESLSIIHQMIQMAKQEQKDNGLGWIIWGWALFIVSLLTYLNIQFAWYNVAFFWNVFSGIVLLYLLYSIVRYFFLHKQKQVKTYTGDLFSRLNIGFFVFLSLIILAINVGVPASKGFMLLIGLYGFWILIYGTALNFKPSVVAAYITWAIAFLGLFIDKFVHDGVPGDISISGTTVGLQRFQWVMVFHAAAVLFGYIIPGYLAHKEFNRLRKANVNSV